MRKLLSSDDPLDDHMVLNIFCNLVPVRASIPIKNGSACGVPECRLKEMLILSCRFRPFLWTLLTAP